MKKSIFAINESPIHISDRMTGKLNGIPCISTSVLKNTYCQKRAAVPGSICSKCYAINTVNRYSSLCGNLNSNYELLTKSVLPLDQLPVFANVAIARFESFGDIQNKTQVINYINICKVNPSVTFALWTKNTRIVSDAIRSVGKPSNLVIIASSPTINKPMHTSAACVDKVFTVYDKQEIAKKQIDINCGARSCASCRACYNRDNGIRDIREQLK